jgi:hypothetical protein
VDLNAKRAKAAGFRLCELCFSALNVVGRDRGVDVSIPLEIHLMPQRLAAQQAAVVVDEHRRDVGRVAERRGVRRDEEVRRPPEDMLGRQRLLLEHVEHGPREAAFLQRGGERRLVDDAAAARVDEHRTRRQRAQEPGVHEMARLPGRRHDADQVVEIEREGDALAVHRTVKPRVHVGAVLAGARVALDGHAEVFRRARDRRADRPDAEQPNLLAAQRPRPRRVPPACRLRRVLLEEPAFVREEVGEDVFGHQPAEDAAGIGQDVVAAQCRIEQRFDARPRRLRPAHRGHRGHDLPQQRRLAEGQVVVAGTRGGVGGIARRRHLEIGQARGVNEAVIVARVARQDQQPVHAALSHTPWPRSPVPRARARRPCGPRTAAAAPAPRRRRPAAATERTYA